MSEHRRQPIDEPDSKVETNDHNYLAPPYNPPAPPPSPPAVFHGYTFPWRTQLGLACAAILILVLLFLQPATSRFIDSAGDFLTREGTKFTHESSEQFGAIWCDQIGGSRCVDIKRETSHQYYSTGFPAVDRLGEQIQALHMLDLGAEILSEVVKLGDSLEHVGASSDQDEFRRFIDDLRESAKILKESTYSWDIVEALSTFTLQNLQENFEMGFDLLEALVKLLDIIVFGSRASEALSLKREGTDMVVTFKRDSDAVKKALERAKNAAVDLTTWSYEARAKIQLGLHDTQLAHDNYVNHPWRRGLCWMGIFPDTSKMSEDIKAMEVANTFLSNWISKTRELESLCRGTEHTLGLFTTHIEEHARRSQLGDLDTETELRVALKSMEEGLMHVKKALHDAGDI